MGPLLRGITLAWMCTAVALGLPSAKQLNDDINIETGQRCHFNDESPNKINFPQVQIVNPEPEIKVTSIDVNEKADSDEAPLETRGRQSKLDDSKIKIIKIHPNSWPTFQENVNSS